ncbi:MAG: hypothetical protein MJZ84_08625, partial [Paludibacteraceae bacterium]|nr:hypothetical protein [Paludibacteraceae bacterium]
MRKLFSFFAALTLSVGLWAAAPANVESVDLGLSVKWANMNVGATAPEGYGDYFAWGETSTKTTYDWSTYFDTNDDGSTFQKYYLDGGKTVLDPEDDAAHVNWGGNWRMPTYAELDELQTKCTWTWTTLNNISGYEVKGPNNNTIFLPVSGYCFGSSLGSNAGSGGYYWSSSLCESGSSDAYLLLFYPAYMFCYNSNRYYGYSVRPVYVPASAITPVYNTEGDVTSGIARWDTLACADYKVVENATEQVTWGVAGDTTWYVVKDTISLAEGAICVGDVRLILADSAQLTATGNNAGIQVSGTGNSLTIYAQSTGEQMGELVATCIIMGSGIGGDIQKGNSNITINGGKITANGGNNGAGIGGGQFSAGSNITINGGTITANGGNMAAGIGGGRNGTGSNITINGGTVTANGGSMAAGIGGGMQGSGSYITILAGTVTATGGSSAAGIGGGRMSTGSNIFVATTCVVKAGNTPAATTVIENDGTDLASSLTGKLYVTVNTPTVSDLTITGDKYVGTELTFAATVSGFSATPMIIYEVKAGEGEYAQASGGKFTPTATGDYTVKATAFYQPEDGDPEEAFKEVEFTVTEAPTIYTTYTEWQVKYGPAWEWVNMTKQEDGTFTVEAVWGNTGMYIASGTNPIKQDWYPLDDVNVNVEEDVVEGDEVVITLTVVDDETITLNVAKAPAVPYIAPVYNTEGDVTSGIARWDTLACAEYKVVENATEQVTWGIAGDTTWYVVKDTISLAKGAICVGDVRLILADSAQLTATGVTDYTNGVFTPGIQVSGESNSLTIYGQTAQIGQLIANGGNLAAGIGGKEQGIGSNITINGGKITAKAGGGNGGGAGIGGGKLGSGSDITINGGTITATGGPGAAGIGGGDYCAGSNITINGGTIMAIGQEQAAGIGGGYNGSGSYITILAGTVTATGGDYGAGIGGGCMANGSNITILAGTVTAKGGEDGDAIGNGYYAATDASNIFVATSLQVKADGNNPPTTVIENDGTDLADKLADKRYATVEKAPAVPVAPANVESVDLGLPSGLKWANMNVGATAPEGYGDYFAWGETEPKDNYDWSTYFDTNDGGSTFTKYNLDGGKTTLDPEDDAAHVKWGGNWRMPTKAELEELQNNCTWTWTTLNNISGYEVKGPNNNTIFLPVSGYCFGSSLGSNAGSGGYYWSSSLCESGSSDAYLLLFYPAYMFCYNSNRYYGYSVRPVYAPASAPAVPYIAPVYNTEGDVTSGIARWDTLTCAEYKVVENATEAVTWGVAGDTTWYVVKDTISLAKGAICAGDVRLILADSAQLTATGGIKVSGSNSLTIYAQSTGDEMGQLEATGGKYAAGIGGGNEGSGSNITINGGTVEATGGSGAAGIGGGASGSGSNITINGGIVTATGRMSASGIGGGVNGSGSNITINGGKVEAIGGPFASGIGGGVNGSGSNIFVATSLVIKADGNNPPTTVIAATRTVTTDIANDLAGKQYATIETPAAPVAPANVESVDLGLPSGLKWATFNVGATKPEEYGDYFAWGETAPHQDNDYSSGKYTYTDNPTTLPLDHDAATANWGSDWRMPTKAEQEELQNNCTWTWTQKNGINGYEVEGPNKNKIFLPVSGYRENGSLNSVGSNGYYWSSSLNEVYSDFAYGLFFYSDYVVWGTYDRYYGLSVRPVTTKSIAPAPAPAVPYITPVYNTEGDVTSGIARWDTLTCAEYKVVENASEQVTWGVAGDTTWYVVKDTISLAKGAICVGDVRLILADSAQLTATGGINVTGTNSLTIYAQSTGTQMGQLSANSGSMIAGIGGGDSQPGNNITINGGTVEATGGS